MSGRGRPRNVKEKTPGDDPGHTPGDDPGAKDKGSVRRKGSRKDEEEVKEKTPGEATGETPGAKDKGSVRRRGLSKDEEKVKEKTPGEAPGETLGAKVKGSVRRKGLKKDEEEVKEKPPGDAPVETTGGKVKGSVRRKGSKKDEEKVKENTAGDAPGETPGAKVKGSVRRKGSKKDEEEVKENTPGDAPGEGSVRKKGSMKDEEKTGERTEGVEAPEERKKNARSRPRPATQPCDTRPPAPISPRTCAKTEEDQNGPRGSPKRKGSSDADPSRVLQKTLENLRIKATQRSEATQCVNKIQDAVTKHVKGNLDWCKDISVLKTGSHYENVKICESDEFDLMLAVPVERVNICPFGEDGAFYSVALKRHKKHPLDRFLDEDNTIRACEMLTEFREKVKKAADKLPEVSVAKKKKGCPAVTLLVKMGDRLISLDFVLGLEVHSSSWPSFTEKGFEIDDWLGIKVKSDQKRKPYYLVHKYEGTGTREQDGVRAKDAWRISFSHIEKFILNNHGNAKTCCQRQTMCCRKQCLKLLKYLLKKLKEKYPKEAEKLCSYHAKTTLLHACAARVEDRKWAADQLSDCFQQLLQDFEKHLKECNLSNFFIPSHNLLKSAGLDKKSGEALAKYIEYERNNGFPLFRESGSL